MSARDDKIRQVVAELDVHIAEVEASVAVLKALLADDQVPGGRRRPQLTHRPRWQAAYESVDARPFRSLTRVKGGGSGEPKRTVPKAGNPCLRHARNLETIQAVSLRITIC